MFNGVNVPVEDQLKFFYDAWGTDRTYNHMAIGWTWAFDTPFSWTKQIASHFGGTRQGMCVSWPGHINDARQHSPSVSSRHRCCADNSGGLRHPTARREVDGIKQSPIEGVSFAYTSTRRTWNEPSTHKTQSSR